MVEQQTDETLLNDAGQEVDAALLAWFSGPKAIEIDEADLSHVTDLVEAAAERYLARHRFP